MSQQRNEATITIHRSPSEKQQSSLESPLKKQNTKKINFKKSISPSPNRKIILATQSQKQQKIQMLPKIQISRQDTNESLVLKSPVEGTNSEFEYNSNTSNSKLEQTSDIAALTATSMQSVSVTDHFLQQLSLIDISTVKQELLFSGEESLILSPTSTKKSIPKSAFWNSQSSLDSTLLTLGIKTNSDIFSKRITYQQIVGNLLLALQNIGEKVTVKYNELEHTIETQKQLLLKRSSTPIQSENSSTITQAYKEQINILNNQINNLNQKIKVIKYKDDLIQELRIQNLKTHSTYIESINKEIKRMEDFLNKATQRGVSIQKCQVCEENLSCLKESIKNREGMVKQIELQGIQIKELQDIVNSTQNSLELQKEIGYQMLEKLEQMQGKKLFDGPEMQNTANIIKYTYQTLAIMNNSSFIDLEKQTQSMSIQKKIAFYTKELQIQNALREQLELEKLNKNQNKQPKQLNIQSTLSHIKETDKSITQLSPMTHQSYLGFRKSYNGDEQRQRDKSFDQLGIRSNKLSKTVKLSKLDGNKKENTSQSPLKIINQLQPISKVSSLNKSIQNDNFLNY